MHPEPSATPKILGRPLHLLTPRYLLRDFVAADRSEFVAYQMDARYRGLYDFAEDDEQRAQDLFDLFLSWSTAVPRTNLQLGIFEKVSGQLCGSGGLRSAGRKDGEAVLGIELTPGNWGRYRLALEVVEALGDYGFRELNLSKIIADSSSGNTSVAKLARWFGAEAVALRDGPDWMQSRGWHEVDWALDRTTWEARQRRS